jgi:hypothetical protein
MEFTLDRLLGSGMACPVNEIILAVVGGVGPALP